MERNRGKIEKFRGRPDDSLLRKLAKLCNSSKSEKKRNRVLRQMLGIVNKNYARVVFYLQWSGAFDKYNKKK